MPRRRRPMIAFCFMLAMASATAEAEPIILNGSFENNTASSTMFNLNTLTFNATVADATAFGDPLEIDLVTGTAFGLAPQSGDWKLGLRTNPSTPGVADGFSLSLSTGLVGGLSYDLAFFGGLLDNSLFGTVPGPIEIGVSNSATGFGTLVFSGTPTGALSSWTAFRATFIAPEDATFLTVRSGSVPNQYVFVDNFSLAPTTPVPEPVPEPTSLLLFASGAAACLARARRRKSQPEEREFDA